MSETLETTLRATGARRLEDAHDCHESGLPCDLDCVCACFVCEEDQRDLRRAQDPEYAPFTDSLPDLSDMVAQIERRATEAQKQSDLLRAYVTQLLAEVQRSIVNECGCGKAYTLEMWSRLPLVGRLDDGEGGELELRNCSCGSTRAIPVQSERGAA